MEEISASNRRVRVLLIFFMAALVVSGLTAIPLKREIEIINELAGPGSWLGASLPALALWLGFLREGLTDAYGRYPFLAYGTDWLAFGHLVIALAFIGPLRDPRGNIWVIEFGMIACLLIIPWTLIFGALRAIPPFWRLIDMSFGLFGMIPLWLAYREIRYFQLKYDKS